MDVMKDGISGWYDDGLCSVQLSSLSSLTSSQPSGRALELELELEGFVGVVVC